MRSLFHILAILNLLSAVTLGQPPQALDTTPVNDIPQFEIVVPQPPTAFRTGDRFALCYELFITNIKDAAFSLTRVKAIGPTGRTLLDSHGVELGQALVPAGERRATNERPAPIDGGQRIVFFAWVELPPNDSAPPMLRHELTFETARGGASFVIAGAETPVLTQLRTIAAPFRGENWCAVNGPSNTSAHRRVMLSLNGLARSPERFAIDYVQIDAKGATFTGDRGANASYLCYSREALAVADGIVSAFKDGIPENKPGDGSRAVTITPETVGGNYVILDLGDGLFAFYAHLQPGKIRVKLGDRVKAGDVLGLVGNSGNSTEPHLHFHLCDRNSPLACQGMPYAMASFIARGRASEMGVEWLKPPVERINQMPAENEVISVSR